jgi:hypothetical protein
VAQAISYVEDQWFNCTAGGYQILVTKSIATAQIGTTSSPSFSSFQSRAVGAPIAGRPAITVNGR